MRFLVCLLLLGIFGAMETFGQNLIRNPSFEDYNPCPDDHGQIERADFWENANNSSPDLYNRCAVTPPGMMCSACVPDSYISSQEPRTGDGYAAFFALWFGDVREYIQVELVDPLEANESYEVSYYVSLSDRCFHALEHMGALLTDTRLNRGKNRGIYDMTPQVLDEKPYTDKEGWTLVSGCFVADGTEKFLVLGNFLSDVDSKVITLTDGDERHIHYLIDDVSLIKVAPSFFNLGSDTTLCKGDSLVIDLSKYPGNISWNDGGSERIKTIRNSGTFWVSVFTECQAYSDTINITFEEVERPNIGRDTTLCEGETLLLLGSTIDIDHNWQNGSSDTFFLVSDEGYYWLELITRCGIIRDSIYIDYADDAEINLGMDTILCDGDSLVLNTNIDLNVIWQDGTTTNNYVVKSNGDYWVSGKNNCGEASDTINVSYIELPTIDLGGDLTVCDMDSILLQIEGDGNEILWSTGATTESVYLKNSGSISVEVFNECGSAQDEIEVIFEKCKCDYYVPNIFSPNGDGINDSLGPLFSECPVEDFRFRVFSRWGELVFDTDEANNRWDGTHLGKRLPSDVFVYTLAFKDEGGIQSSSGSITLIR